MLEQNVLIPFLKKFDEYPFLVKMDGKEYRIGEGAPTFTVVFDKTKPPGVRMDRTNQARGGADI